ncbi:MAG: hypothetical protein AAGI90_01060 [Chlamydiota bacterium]
MYLDIHSIPSVIQEGYEALSFDAEELPLVEKVFLKAIVSGACISIGTGLWGLNASVTRILRADEVGDDEGKRLAKYSLVRSVIKTASASMNTIVVESYVFGCSEKVAILRNFTGPLNLITSVCTLIFGCIGLQQSQEFHHFYVGTRNARFLKNRDLFLNNPTFHLKESLGKLASLIDLSETDKREKGVLAIENAINYAKKISKGMEMVQDQEHVYLEQASDHLCSEEQFPALHTWWSDRFKNFKPTGVRGNTLLCNIDFWKAKVEELVRSLKEQQENAQTVQEKEKAQSRISQLQKILGAVQNTREAIEYVLPRSHAEIRKELLELLMHDPEETLGKIALEADISKSAVSPNSAKKWCEKLDVLLQDKIKELQARKSDYLSRRIPYYLAETLSKDGRIQRLLQNLEANQHDATLEALEMDHIIRKENYKQQFLNRGVISIAILGILMCAVLPYVSLGITPTVMAVITGVIVLIIYTRSADSVVGYLWERGHPKHPMLIQEDKLQSFIQEKFRRIVESRTNEVIEEEKMPDLIKQEIRVFVADRLSRSIEEEARRLNDKEVCILMDKEEGTLVFQDKVDALIKKQVRYFAQKEMEILEENREPSVDASHSFPVVLEMA